MKTDAYFFPDFDSAHLENLIKEWKSSHPQSGIFTILPEKETERVEELQRIAGENACPLTGAIFPRLVYNNNFMEQGIIIILFHTMPDYLTLESLSRQPEEYEKQVNEFSAKIRELINEQSKNNLFMLFDAMVPNINTILDQLYLNLADLVSYSGVNAGSETFNPMPCLFTSDRLFQNGILAFLFENTGEASLAHGYHAPQKMITATSTSGNRINSINWRPAFEVYSEVAQSEYQVTITAENFYENGVHFPFGILRADGIVVRIPVALEEDGSLYCIGEVPENSILTLLYSSQVSCQETVDLLSERTPEGTGNLLTFYCAGRRLHMGEKAEEELSMVRQMNKGEHLFGALSLGEIGSQKKGGYPLFHNAALVCLRI